MLCVSFPREILTFTQATYGVGHVHAKSMTWGKTYYTYNI